MPRVLAVSGRLFEMTPSDILTIFSRAAFPLGSFKLRVTLVRCEGLRNSPRIAGGWFDFDHFGAHIGENLSGEGAGDEVAKLDDLDAFEWAFFVGAVCVGSVMRCVLSHDDANITLKIGGCF